MEDDFSLESTRADAFAKEDRHLYLHVGFFISWFSAVELRISMLLALATQTPRMEGFELLTRGMDARVKVDRLRRACEGSITIGPHLAARLTLFENQSIPLRNKMSHSFLSIDPGYESVHLASISRLPYAAYGRQQEGKPPENLPLIQIFEHGLWLAFLNHDLGNVQSTFIKSGLHAKILEIDHPRSPLLPGASSSPPQPKQRASEGRRERKRARKGQLRRGKPRSF
jgi:hypothetical protein